MFKDTTTKVIECGFKPNIIYMFFLNKYGDHTWFFYNFGESKGQQINNSGQGYGYSANVSITNTGFTASIDSTLGGYYIAAK